MLRFPYMFSDPRMNFEFYRGWFPWFVYLCFVLDELLWDEHKDERNRFRWTQLKERFGGYHMHFAFRLPALTPGAVDNEEQVALTALRDQIRSRIKRCASGLDTTCFVCGFEGTRRVDGGWTYTLCEFHSPQARTARGDVRWIRELAAFPKLPERDIGGNTS
jgi:hypothetical protein